MPAFQVYFLPYAVSGPPSTGGWRPPGWPAQPTAPAVNPGVPTPPGNSLPPVWPPPWRPFTLPDPPYVPAGSMFRPSPGGGGVWNPPAGILMPQAGDILYPPAGRGTPWDPSMLRPPQPPAQPTGFPAVGWDTAGWWRGGGVGSPPTMPAAPGQAMQVEGARVNDFLGRGGGPVTPGRPLFSTAGTATPGEVAAQAQAMDALVADRLNGMTPGQHLNAGPNPGNLARGGPFKPYRPPRVGPSGRPNPGPGVGSNGPRLPPAVAPALYQAFFQQPDAQTPSFVGATEQALGLAGPQDQSTNGELSWQLAQMEQARLDATAESAAALASALVDFGQLYNGWFGQGGGAGASVGGGIGSYNLVANPPVGVP